VKELQGQCAEGGLIGLLFHKKSLRDGLSMVLLLPILPMVVPLLLPSRIGRE
jgi:hypothetical protein